MVERTLPLLALLAVVLSPATSARAEEVKQASTRLWLTPELFSFGGLEIPSGTGDCFRIASLDLRYGGLRIGTSFVEDGYSIWSVSVLPVRVGLTVWQLPRRYWWKLHGMTPEVYVQATAASWLPGSDGPGQVRFVGHAEARFAVDIYGVGCDIGTGALVLNQSESEVEPYKWIVRPALDFRIRLGVANFRL